MKNIKLLLALSFLALVQISCTDSDPVIEELSSNLDFLSFSSGKSSDTVVVVTSGVGVGQPVAITGECDKRVKSLEVSINNGSYQSSSQILSLLELSELECDDGTFTLESATLGSAGDLYFSSLPITHKLAIRGLTFAGYTSEIVVYINAIDASSTTTTTSTTSTTTTSTTTTSTTSTTTTSTTTTTTTTSTTTTTLAAGPPPPTAVNLFNTSKSPGSAATASIEIHGLVDGDIIRLYSDPGCTTLKGGPSTPETGGDGKMTWPTNTLTPGLNKIYATIERGSIESLCSSDYAVYTYDNTNPLIVSSTFYSHYSGSTRTYYYKDRVEVALLFSEPVIFDTTGGKPYLVATLSGGSNATLDLVYDRMDSDIIAIFSHQVKPGDVDTDGISVSSNLNLGGGAVKDSSGRALSTFTFTPPSSSQAIVDDRKFCGQIITAPFPSAYSAINAGTYGLNDFDFAICTEAQLRDFATSCNAGSGCNSRIILMDYVEFDGSPTMPIGNATSPFTGIFEGNWRSVSHLNFTANLTSSDGSGFFGNVEGHPYPSPNPYPTMITNLMMGENQIGSSGTPRANPYNGILAGRINSSSSYKVFIKNVYAGQGSEIWTSDQYSGGLIGFGNKIDIRNSAADVRVTGVNPALSNYVGGLAGYILGSDLTLVSAFGDVEGRHNVGGLVGGVFASGATNPVNIKEATSANKVSVLPSAATAAAGGLVGQISLTAGGVATLSDNQALDPIGLSGSGVECDLTNDLAGGLVGLINSGPEALTLTNNFAAKTLNCMTVGGIVGFAAGSAIAASGQVFDSDLAPSASMSLASSLPTSELYLQNNFTEMNWSFVNSWSIAQGVSYPFLRNRWFPEDDPSVVFVTSNTFLSNGNLNGLAGADEICRNAASTGGQSNPYSFKAILSDQYTNAVDRLKLEDGDIKDTFGNLIAQGGGDMFDGTILMSINRNESGGTLPGTPYQSWTGSTAVGTVNSFHCSNWTSTSGNGVTGSKSASDSNWIYNSSAACSSSIRLYCISTHNAYETLNPNFNPGNVSFSAGETQVDFGSPGTNRMVRGKGGKLSSKYYFEVEVVSMAATAFTSVGLINSLVTPNKEFTLNSFSGQMYAFGCNLDGDCFQNGILASGSWSDLPVIGAATERIQVAIDLSTRNIWFGKNGVWVATGGPGCTSGLVNNAKLEADSCATFNYTSGSDVGGMFPAASIGSSAGGSPPSLRFHFKQSSWANTPPINFYEWDE